MAQLEIFYSILTFIIGVLSLGFAVFFFSTTRSVKLRAFIIFYALFTLLNISNFITSYIRTNVPDYKGVVYFLLLYLENPVTFILLMAAVPYFIHTLLDLPDQKKRNIIFLIIAFVVFAIHNGLFFLNTNLGMFDQFPIFKNVSLLLVLIYCWYTLFIYSKKGTFERKFSYLWGLIIPAVLNDTLFLQTTNVKVFPIIYSLIGVSFTHYFYKTDVKSSDKGNNDTIQHIPEDISEKYGLSEREIEVIKLLLLGKSYKQISEALFISINTVKTHIRNIYPKLNVSSRHEIVHLFRNKT